MEVFCLKSVFDKLGLYDFLGYIIPGFLGILAMQIFYENILNISFPLILDDSLINSIVFVAISYFSGVIMHEISQFVQEKVLKKIWKGMPSEKFLLKADSVCSINEKKSYYSIANDAFGINDEEYDKEKSQLVFDRFRTALQQAGKDERSQLFNTYYGMYRNFSTGTLICFLAYLIYSVIVLINIIFFKVNIAKDISYIVNGLAFLSFTLILFRRTRRFGETYVKYVFRGFAEYYRNQMNTNNNKMEEIK